MKVSIALATYNGAKFVDRQLRSFAEQVRRPDELVICDDASTDETMGIIDAFRRDAPFEVRVVRNESNLGFVRNFEKALSLCRGDVIFLSDQDDVWLPDKLARISEIFEAAPETLLVVNDQWIADAALVLSARTQLQNVSSARVPLSNFGPGCCMALAQRWRDFCLPFPSSPYGHDVWIGRLLALSDLRILVRKPLQIHRRHGKNVSGAMTSWGSEVSQIDVVKLHGLRDTRVMWGKELVLLEQYQCRIVERSNSNPDIGRIARRLLDVVESRSMALRGRSALLSQPRIVRSPGVIVFWLSGGYRHFSGLRSLLKDLLR